MSAVLAAASTAGALSPRPSSPQSVPTAHSNSTSSSPAPLPPIPGAAQAEAGPAPFARIPGFAAWLADQPIGPASEAWRAMPDADAWHAIAVAASADRQAARWLYVKSLIATARGADAIGVLDVMIADDPDLALVPAWQRASGVAQIQAWHLVGGIAALRQPGLARDPEACLWRMKALSDRGEAQAALADFNCALPALNARRGAARTPFILAAARAATDSGRHRDALILLARLPDQNTTANVLRGKADLALGLAQEGRLRLARVDLSGRPEERAEAALVTIEDGLAKRTLPVPEALKRLDVLLIGWRGGAIERRALSLSMRLGEQTQDATRELGAGSILTRYFDLGADAGPLVERLRSRLAVLLAPGSAMPLTRAVGLFWDYRDFAPGGIAGLRLAEMLVARLQAAGLYARAADLLDHRLVTARDVEQGPLSIRIAGLRILAGDPAAAIRAIRETDDVAYSADLTAQRGRLEAVGLTLLGKSREALAVLDDVPDGLAISAEIYWRAHDWARLEAVGTALLPPPGQLTEVGQAIVLRQAISSAMLGHSDALERLHRRYARGFMGLPAGAAFELLAGNPDKVDPAALTRAMGAMPTASPIGAIGDMMDAGQAAMASRAETSASG
ncbi:hypothetical protein [Sphingomonas sp. Leaf357]|uniref:hypothetical protein n=1 Tax=Sphingomonas sp. Leaf357 TaxID=1736350 RepID=UPI0012E1814D|nr:hypothetical protein [Sphingomonas sp. Leaf357]